jgi:hypothetical protein
MALRGVPSEGVVFQARWPVLPNDPKLNCHVPLDDWKDISPKDGGFSVKMPGVPEEKSQKIEAIQGPAQITLWGIERDGAAYMVIRTELPPAVVAGGPRKTLDEARDKGVRKSGGTLREEKEIEMNGHPGRELVLDLPDSRFRGGAIYKTRIYLVGRTQYQVITASSKAKERPGQMKAFLESFRLEVHEPRRQ